MTRVVIVGEIFNADLSVGGGPMPGWGGPVDPGYGGGWGGGPHPGNRPPGSYPGGHPGNRPPGSWGGPVDPGWGSSGGEHPSTGPIYGGGHPSTGPVYPPGLRPGNELPGAPAHPDQGLPPGVEVWPPPPSASTKPIEPDEGLSPENPIALPAPEQGAVVLVWVSGVGYRYVTIGEAEPK